MLYVIPFFIASNHPLYKCVDFFAIQQHAWMHNNKFVYG